MTADLQHLQLEFQDFEAFRKGLEEIMCVGEGKTNVGMLGTVAILIIPAQHERIFL